MSKCSNRLAAIGVLSAVAFGTIAAAPAYAKTVKVQTHGTCSKGAHWKLSLGPDGRIIETEFEVDSNHAGQKWNVTIGDNGTRVFTGLRTTTAPSGSFSVARRIPNRAGVDHVVATAKNARSGETCIARASS